MGGVTILKAKADSGKLVAVGKALKRHADGKELRKLMISEFKTALDPVKTEIKASAKRIPSATKHDGVKLRDALARSVSVKVKLSGKSTGIRIVSRKSTVNRLWPMVPRSVNRGRFRKRTRSGQWVVQEMRRSKDWFDGVTRRHRPEITKSTRDVLKKYSKIVAKELKAAAK